MARHASGEDNRLLASPDDGRPAALPPPSDSASSSGRDPMTTQGAVQHRLSVEDDYLYQEVMSHTLCRFSKEGPASIFRTAFGPRPQEPPPSYTCSVHAESVFMMKLEVENATRRAEDRRWHQVYAILHGTTINIYRPKKGWGWGRKTDAGRSGTRDWDSGPAQPPSEDRPLGVKPGKLVKSYGLLHSDAGIASDYRKRRYVLRVRADADQFLLSCLQLETFIQWLDGLFAAIDIAVPLEERDFPKDQSIPRVQRLRLMRGQGHLRAGDRSPSIATYPSPTSGGTAGALARAAGAERRGPVINVNGELVEPRTSRDCRLSTANNIDENGKWKPRHTWTRRHDLLYAKLCYSTLLFRSPRKSSYVIMDGDEWYVDWPTGRMARCRPPGYSQTEV